VLAAHTHTRRDSHAAALLTRQQQQRHTPARRRLQVPRIIALERRHEVGGIAAIHHCGSHHITQQINAQRHIVSFYIASPRHITVHWWVHSGGDALSSEEGVLARRLLTATPPRIADDVHVLQRVTATCAMRCDRRGGGGGVLEGRREHRQAAYRSPERQSGRTDTDGSDTTTINRHTSTL
jgi:hypothetical protein